MCGFIKSVTILIAGYRVINKNKEEYFQISSLKFNLNFSPLHITKQNAHQAVNKAAIVNPGWMSPMISGKNYS